MAARDVAPVPRITLRLGEAAEALGVSPEYFDQHVRRELRLVYRGRLVLVPVTELVRWAERSATAIAEGS